MYTTPARDGISYSTDVERFSLRLIVRFFGAAGAGAVAAAAGALGLPGDRFGCAI